MAASTRHLWFLVLAAALCSKVARGFEWEASSPQDGAIIKACAMEKISLPWKFSATVDEMVMYVEWHKERDGNYQIIATNVAGFFVKLPTTKLYIEFLPNAGILISNLTRQDYGKYRVNVVYKVNGTLHTESTSTILELPDTPVLEDNRLTAHIQPEPITDVITRERHLQLACGTVLTQGSRPLVVEWKTPSSTIVPSSSYSNGTFYLTLPNPVVGGTYICRLKDPSLVAGCMINNLFALRQGDYVMVDAVQARLKLLEGNVQDQHEKDTSVDAELDRQDDVDDNLISADERLTSRVDDLHQQFVEQKKVDVTQNSDIIRLSEELTSQKATDTAMMSDVRGIQGKILQQGKTDEELKTKVTRLEKTVEELKTASERLTSGVDDLHQQFVEQKKVDVKQNSDIIHLSEELTSQKANDTAMTSDIRVIQEKIVQQGKTDEELKTKVTRLEADISEMKALRLKELLQQAEAKWASDLKRIEDKFHIILSCPNYGFQSSCYKVVTEKLTWSDAKGRCSSLGGKLAEITSSAKNDYIINEVLKDFEKDNYWIGGTDEGSEGNWKWASGGTVPKPNAWGTAGKPWLKGEPNNSHMGKPEHCLSTLHSGSSYEWNDVMCHIQIPSICEM